VNRRAAVERHHLRPACRRPSLIEMLMVDLGRVQVLDGGAVGNALPCSA